MKGGNHATEGREATTKNDAPEQTTKVGKNPQCKRNCNKVLIKNILWMRACGVDSQPTL